MSYESDIEILKMYIDSGQFWQNACLLMQIREVVHFAAFKSARVQLLLFGPDRKEKLISPDAVILSVGWPGVHRFILSKYLHKSMFIQKNSNELFNHLNLLKNY